MEELALKLAKERLAAYIGRAATLSSGELSAKLGMRQAEMKLLLGAAGIKRNRYRRWPTDQVIKALQDALEGAQRYDPLRERWIDWATKFYIGDLNLFNSEATPIYIMAQPKLNGKIKWTVNAHDTNGWVLSKDLEWIYEPPVNERTYEFLANTRFNSKGEALVMLKRFVDEKGRALLYYSK